MVSHCFLGLSPSTMSRDGCTSSPVLLSLLGINSAQVDQQIGLLVANDNLRSCIHISPDKERNVSIGGLRAAIVKNRHKRTVSQGL